MAQRFFAASYTPTLSLSNRNNLDHDVLILDAVYQPVPRTSQFDFW